MSVGEIPTIFLPSSFMRFETISSAADLGLEALISLVSLPAPTSSEGRSETEGTCERSATGVSVLVTVGSVPP
jgi:hypothetical protein